MTKGDMEDKASSEKKEKGRNRQSAVEPESKEAKRARKEAKKKAMAIDLSVSEAGPSSSMSRLVSSKSELEVARLLNPDLEGDLEEPGFNAAEGAGESSQRENKAAKGKKKSMKEKKEKKLKAKTTKNAESTANDQPQDQVNDADTEFSTGRNLENEGDVDVEKGKKKKARRKTGGAVDEDAVDLETGDGRRRKKNTELGQGSVETEKKEKTEKRKGKREAGTAAYNSEGDASHLIEEDHEEPSKSDRKIKKEETKKKSRKVETAGEDDNVPIESDSLKQSGKEKKEKKKRKRVDDAELKETEAVSSEGSKKKQKKPKDHRSSISIESIDADEALGESAKKALIYVHQYSTSHDSPTGTWKFNKAKQIWLVKHIWELDQVPEIYLALVVGYLRTIQGKGRAHLIEVAKKHSLPSPSIPNADASPENAADPKGDEDVEEDNVQVTVETTSTAKRVGFADTSEGAPVEEVQNEVDASILAEQSRVRVERAKAVLKALGAR